MNFAEGQRKGWVIQRVWFTDMQNPSLQQPPVSLAAYIPEDSGPGFAFISKDGIRTAQILAEPATLPRRLPVRGNPNRVIASQRLRLLVVAAVWTVGKETQPEHMGDVWTRTRSTRGILQFVDPSKEFNSEQEEELDSELPDDILVLPPGERINCLVDWVHKAQDESERGWIVLGVTSSEQDRKTGKVIWVHTSRGDDGVLRPRLGRRQMFSDPVYAVAELDNTALVVCSGKTLQVLRVDNETNK